MHPNNSAKATGCLAILTGLLGSLAWASQSSSPEVGTAAPDFSAYNYVTGAKTRLSDQHGKVVILTFWATWCAPCRNELPNLEGIQERAGQDQLVVLAVNYRDSDEAMAYLKKGARKAGWKISLLEDPSGGIASKYGINSIPHLFLIGRDGHIAATHSGFGEGSLDLMLPEINAALAGNPVPAPAADK